MNEKAIAASIMKWLRKLPDTCVWKITDMNNVGFPDITGVHRGMAFFFEVKQPKGRTTPKQSYEIERIRAAGGRAHVVYSLENVKNAMAVWFGL